jgi:hypothetical protein
MTGPDTSTAASTRPAPVFTLYDTTTVGVATFLGSALAGSAVMALNYKRLGRSSTAWLTLGVGVLVTGLLVASGFFLPSGPWDTGIGIGLLIGTIRLANNLQRGLVDAHRQAGGKVGSRWVGAAIGIGVLIIVGGSILGFAIATMDPSPSHLMVGAKDEIYYSGHASEGDARSLGDALKNDGFFQDRGVTVVLRKDEDGTVLGIFVKDGGWNNPEAIPSLTAVARDAAPSIGGLPIKLQLLDSTGEVKKEIPIQ